MKEPNYIIERWEHGWVLASAPGQQGIPLDALTEASELTRNCKKALIETSIIQHLRASGKSRHAVICFVPSKEESETWRAEIIEEIAVLPPEERWWKGLDTGLSSTAIFAVLATTEAKYPAMGKTVGETPSDAADFGRCARLLEMFPEWGARLPEVAARYPKTKWPAIIARWDELTKASSEEQYKILSEINHEK